MPRTVARELASIRANQIGFFRAKEVAQLLGIHEMTVWRWARSGRFPRPIKIGVQVTGWFARDIAQWLEQKRQASQRPAL
jgi:predicted DNA-binding transcriptional regulator AlpA